MYYNSQQNPPVLIVYFCFSRCCYVNCDGMLFFSLWCSERGRKRSQYVTSKVMYIYINITDLDRKECMQYSLCNKLCIFLSKECYLWFYPRKTIFSYYLYQQRSCHSFYSDINYSFLIKKFRRLRFPT